jgi:DNA-directed RNA polymerase specialized sigma24 family protein
MRVHYYHVISDEVPGVCSGTATSLEFDAGVARNTAAALVEAYYDRTWRFLYGVSRDQEVASDLTQETFLAVAKSLGGFRGVSSPLTWITKIALNKYRA